MLFTIFIVLLTASELSLEQDFDAELRRMIEEHAAEIKVSDYKCQNTMLELLTFKYIENNIGIELLEDFYNRMKKNLTGQISFLQLRYINSIKDVDICQILKLIRETKNKIKMNYGKLPGNNQYIEFLFIRNIFDYEFGQINEINVSKTNNDENGKILYIFENTLDCKNLDGYISKFWNFSMKKYQLNEEKIHILSLIYDTERERLAKFFNHKIYSKLYIKDIYELSNSFCNRFIDVYDTQTVTLFSDGKKEISYHSMETSNSDRKEIIILKKENYLIDDNVIVKYEVCDECNNDFSLRYYNITPKKIDVNKPIEEKILEKYKRFKIKLECKMLYNRISYETRTVTLSFDFKPMCIENKNFYKRILSCSTNNEFSFKPIHEFIIDGEDNNSDEYEIYLEIFLKNFKKLLFYSQSFNVPDVYRLFEFIHPKELYHIAGSRNVYFKRALLTHYETIKKSFLELPKKFKTDTENIRFSQFVFEIYDNFKNNLYFHEIESLVTLKLCNKIIFDTENDSSSSNIGFKITLGTEINTKIYYFYFFRYTLNQRKLYEQFFNTIKRNFVQDFLNCFLNMDDSKWIDYFKLYEIINSSQFEKIIDFLQILDNNDKIYNLSELSILFDFVKTQEFNGISDEFINLINFIQKKLSDNNQSDFNIPKIIQILINLIDVKRSFEKTDDNFYNVCSFIHEITSFKYIFRWYDKLKSKTIQNEFSASNYYYFIKELENTTYDEVFKKINEWLSIPEFKNVKPLFSQDLEVLFRKNHMLYIVYLLKKYIEYCESIFHFAIIIEEEEKNFYSGYERIKDIIESELNQSYIIDAYS